MLPPSHALTCRSPRRASWIGRALAQCLLDVGLVAALFLAATSVAAAEEVQRRDDGPYAKSPFPATPNVRLVRDVSAFGAYPPVVSPSRERIASPGPAAPRTPVYPPSGFSPAPTPPLPACGVFTNCSFESGGLGWSIQDVSSPLLPLGAYPAGTSSGFGTFLSAPTDGLLAALTGWDCNGPGDIILAQDIILQPDAARLEFSYRAGWDMFNYPGSALDRTFSVQIQPAGGGSVLQSTTVLTAPAATVILDTGDLTGVVDISAFAGQPVRVLFVWHVPESFTGPAMFQLDRVQVRENNCMVVDNCSFETGTPPAWLVGDLVTPLIAADVRASGTPLYFNLCTPTDGGFAFSHGWDGSPGDIFLSQDVTLPANTSSIEFDYRAGWQILGTLPRTFSFDVEPSGGGLPLSSQLILTAPANSTGNIGPKTGHVDLRPFAGQTVRLVFRWRVPENVTGPADFQLDRIRLTQGFCASIDNCSFETGGFPAWTATDAVTPFAPMFVGAAGNTPGFGLFMSQPTDGTQALLHGFDAAGPDVITLTQDLTLPLWADVLQFDYRAGWDMVNFQGSTLPRTFEVAIEPSGGGVPLASDLVFEAPPQTVVLDTGPLTRRFSLGAYAGQAVRLVFRWSIPEYFTGPAFFQLDRVMIDNSLLAVGPGGSPGWALDLQPATPNPSRDATTFAYTLAQAGDVELEVVDVRGARVWGERRPGQPAGEHHVAWSGMRAAGGAAPPGVYYARVRTDQGSSSRMFVRVR